MCFVLPRHDSEGRQRGSDPFRKLARALGKLEIDSPDAVGAEIGFERDGMLLLAVPVEIGLTTEHADFLCTGPQQADGAAGLAPGHHIPCRRGDAAASPPLLARARGTIPTFASDAADERARGRVRSWGPPPARSRR